MAAVTQPDIVMTEPFEPLERLSISCLFVVG